MNRPPYSSPAGIAASNVSFEKICNDIKEETELIDGKEKENVCDYGWDKASFNLGITTGRRFYNAKTGALYELTDTLGSGAAATVFKCLRVCNSHNECRGGEGNGRHSKEGKAESEMFAAKVVDLKALKLRGNAEKEKLKMQREVEILRRLRHPCIVNLVDVVESSNELFLVMELVKGGELFYRIIESGSLNEPQACYVLHQVISAIKYMHGENVIHRDIKPENILVADTVQRDYYVIKVADFGLAKYVSGSSVAKTFVGTPQYWAPEVIDSSRTGEPYGIAADLWSLGVLLYVMLGGAYPFDDRLGPTAYLIKNGQFHFRWPRFQRVSESAKNLIRGLLTVEISRRFTVEQVNEHPWMVSWLHPLDRIKFNVKCAASDASFHMPQLPSFESVSVSDERLDTKKEAVAVKNLKESIKDFCAKQSEGCFSSASSSQGEKVSPSCAAKEGNDSSKKCKKPCDMNGIKMIHAKPASSSSAALSSAAPTTVNAISSCISDNSNFFLKAVDPKKKEKERENEEEEREKEEEEREKEEEEREKEEEEEKKKENEEEEKEEEEKKEKEKEEEEKKEKEKEEAAGGCCVESSSSRASSSSSGFAPMPHSAEATGGGELVSPFGGGGGGLGSSPIRLFDLEDLMQLQLSAASRLQLASLAFRHNLGINKLIQSYIMDCYEIISETVSVISKLEQTCVSVLSVLPDLSLALTENVPDLAIQLLTDIGKWTSHLAPEAEAMQKKNHKLVRDISDLIVTIRDVIQAQVEYVISHSSNTALSDVSSKHTNALSVYLSANGNDGNVPFDQFAIKDRAYTISSLSSVTPPSPCNSPKHCLSPQCQNVADANNGMLAFLSCSSSPSSNCMAVQPVPCTPFAVSTCMDAGKNLSSLILNNFSSSSSNIFESSKAIVLDENQAVLPSIEALRQKLVNELECIVKEVFPHLSAELGIDAAAPCDDGIIVYSKEKENKIKIPQPDNSGVNHNSNYASNSASYCFTNFSTMGDSDSSSLLRQAVNPQHLASELLDFLFLSPVCTFNETSSLEEQTKNIVKKRLNGGDLEIMFNDLNRCNYLRKNKSSSADDNKSSSADDNKSSSADDNKSSSADDNKSSSADDNKSSSADDNKGKILNMRYESEKSQDSYCTQHIELLSNSSSLTSRISLRSNRSFSSNNTISSKTSVCTPRRILANSHDNNKLAVAGDGTVENGMLRSSNSMSTSQLQILPLMKADIMTKQMLSYGLQEAKGEESKLRSSSNLSPTATYFGTSNDKNIRNSPQKKEKRIQEAIATSNILQRAVDGLRCVDIILDRCSLFWNHMNCTIQCLCQMKEHTQRLIHFAHHAVFRQQLEKRLELYRRFWECLRIHCRNYIEKIDIRCKKIKQFCLHLNSTADKVDLCKLLNALKHQY